MGSEVKVFKCFFPSRPRGGTTFGFDRRLRLSNASLGGEKDTSNSRSYCENRCEAVAELPGHVPRTFTDDAAPSLRRSAAGRISIKPT